MASESILIVGAQVVPSRCMLEWAIANHFPRMREPLGMREPLEDARLRSQSICKTTCLLPARVLADRCRASMCIAAPWPLWFNLVRTREVRANLDNIHGHHEKV